MYKSDKPRIIEGSSLLSNKCKAIKEFLENDSAKKALSCNNLIALYGEWGSGKSSLLKMIDKEINKNMYHTVTFEAWKYEKFEDLPFSLVECIVDSIDTIQRALIEETIKQSKVVTQAMLNGSFKKMFPNFFSEYKRLNEKNNKNSSYTEIENFIDEANEIISKVLDGKKVLVLIDDLDRCEDNNIIRLLTELKLTFTFKNIYFLCGIDKKAVMSTLETKYPSNQKAEKFLEKIFHFDFNISNEFDYSIFENNNEEFDNLKIHILNILKMDNPRFILKIVNKFRQMKCIESLNINDYVLLNLLVTWYSGYFDKEKIAELLFGMENRNFKMNGRIFLQKSIVYSSQEKFLESIIFNCIYKIEQKESTDIITFKNYLRYKIMLEIEKFLKYL